MTAQAQEFIWHVHHLFPQVMFYTLAVVTFGTAVPAGQFVPGIMIGSTYGRLVGMFVVSVYKKPNIDEGTWVLLFLSSLLLQFRFSNGVLKHLHSTLFSGKIVDTLSHLLLACRILLAIFFVLLHFTHS